MGSSRERAGGGNQLSTLNGCYIPCLLTILGAVLFLRLGFAVGMLGLAGALGVLAVSEVISYVTVTSFSAIVTNGQVKGGGAYFMISRSLGPAFGGASGLLFWISYSINATYNVVAFTDVIQSTFIPATSWWGSGSKWSQTAISSLALFPLFLVAYKGAGSFARVNVVIFIGLATACLVVAGSLYLERRSFELPGGEGWAFTPFNSGTLAENMWPRPVVSDQCASAGAFGMGKAVDQVCTVRVVFSVVFPAVVGMMEGLNLSGDLRRPERSIPLGTFWAVSTALAIYVLLMVAQAGTLSREALQFNMRAVQDSTAAGGAFVVLGVATACLSTVLGSIFGAARVLQAMARDDVFPGLSRFKYGTESGDEPRPAIVVSYLLAQAGLFLGSLDDVAPLLTNFFLLTYSLTDLACFLLEYSRVPNFRPTFRFYSWQTSLANSVFVVAVMFYLNWLYALCTVAVVCTVFAYLTVRFWDNVDWIDISQAVLFRVTRHSLLAMQAQRQDPKYWRPSLLLMVPGLAAHTAKDSGFQRLLGLLGKLKQSGLLVVGQAVVSDGVPAWGACSACEAAEGASPRRLARRSLAAALPEYEGFVQVAVAPSGRLACYNLVLGAGLGNMVPDTVVLPLPRSVGGAPIWARPTGSCEPPVATAEEFLQVLWDALHLRKSLLLVNNFDDRATWEGADSTGAGPWRLDVWLTGELLPPPDPGSASKEDTASDDDVAQLSLLLQLAHLACSSAWDTAGGFCGHRLGASAPRIRLLYAGKEAIGGCGSRETVLRRWLQWARIRGAAAQAVGAPSGLPMQPAVPLGGAAVTVLAAAITMAPEGPIGLHDLGVQMRKHSHDAAAVFALLPPLPPHGSTNADMADAYVSQLCDLTAGLPPTVLALNGQGFPVITTSL